MGLHGFCLRVIQGGHSMLKDYVKALTMRSGKGLEALFMRGLFKGLSSLSRLFAAKDRGLDN